MYPCYFHTQFAKKALKYEGRIFGDCSWIPGKLVGIIYSKSG